MKLGRIVTLSVIALALGIEAAAQAPLIGETGIARRGGVYTTLSVGDAAACASLCAADGICLAWTYLDSGSCELTAIAPAPIAMTGARSGLSSRAPAFARRVMPQVELGVVATEAPAPTTLAFVAPEEPATDDFALLGGPEPMAQDGALRPRLGATR